MRIVKKDDSLFYFDEEIVEDFYWFAREFKHVEGILAGEPVELTDFQLFLSANIFGFKKKSNGARRFRKVFIQLARKNAKSQFLAIVARLSRFLVMKNNVLTLLDGPEINLLKFTRL